MSHAISTFKTICSAIFGLIPQSLHNKVWVSKISTFHHVVKFLSQVMIIDCPFGGTTRMCNKKYDDATWCNNLMWGDIVSIS